MLSNIVQWYEERDYSEFVKRPQQTSGVGGGPGPGPPPGGGVGEGNYPN